jgi:hypothetical protein
MLQDPDVPQIRTDPDAIFGQVLAIEISGDRSPFLALVRNRVSTKQADNLDVAR